MSLGIAKIIDNELSINSDTLLTGEDIANHNSQKHSLLKTILINHQVCLVYAGVVLVVEDLIKKINNSNPLSLKSLIALVYQHHQENDQCNDYIIATTLNATPKIHEIKNGRIELNLSTAWVGNKNAFRIFQKNFLEIRTNSNEASAFEKAFEKVINDDTISDVGGFQISLGHVRQNVTKDIYLNYTLRLIMSTMVTQEFLEQNGFSSSEFSTAKNGGFSYSIIHSITPDCPGLGLFFGHVGLGLLFAPKLFGVFPRQFRNCTGEEFVRKSSELGVQLKGMTFNAETNQSRKH